MIESFHIGNFKAFGPTQTIPIRPITLIFGPNSSGKSSLIHSLALAHEANRTGDLDIVKTQIGGSSIDLGGFRQYVHRRDVSNRVEWGIQFNLSQLKEHIQEIFSSVEAIRLDLTIGMPSDDQDRPRKDSKPMVMSYEVLGDSLAV